jgi:uncharacterized protein (TIGR02611 family)
MRAAVDRMKARLLAVRSRLKATRAGRIGVKCAVGIIGVSVILLGIVLLPLPGPGWLIIFAGLATLALEFQWARRLLTFARRQVARWTAWLRRSSWPVRAGSTVATLAIVLGALWLSYSLLD